MKLPNFGAARLNGGGLALERLFFPFAQLVQVPVDMARGGVQEVQKSRNGHPNEPPESG